MTDSVPNPPSSNTATEVAAFLRDRDIQCPSCAAPLRGVSVQACPSCGTALTLAALRTAPGAGLPPAMLAVRVISLIALAIAVYLAYHGIAKKEPAGCSGGGGCSHVLGSRWSSLWGVPVSVPAVLVYLGIFLTTFHVIPALPTKRRRDGWLVLMILATFAGLGAMWFIGIQAFLLQQYCPYCMIDHLCGLTIAAIVLLNAPMWPAKVPGASSEPRASASEDSSAPAPLLPPARVCWYLAAAALAVALLAVAQVLFPGDTHVVQRFTGVTEKGGSLLPKDGASKDGASRNPDDFVVLYLPKSPSPDGNMLVSKAAYPLRGKRDAKFIFVVLADYTCHHCKNLHHHLNKAAKRYGDQFAFLVLPVPMDAKCNPHVYHTDDRHYFACELARLALAVWKADPSKFEEFDDWLFNAPGDSSRTDKASRAEAERLIGKPALDKALASGEPDEILKMTTRVYSAAGLGRIPKMMIREFRIEGQITESGLWGILEDKAVGLVPVKQKE